MTAPAVTEPAFLTAARNIAETCDCNCGASPGEHCIDLGGHAHFGRLSRARQQHPHIMTHELFCDSLNYVLGRDNDVFTDRSDC